MESDSQETEIQSFAGHTGNVTSVAHYKDITVTGSDDRTMRIYSAVDGKCHTTLLGHDDAVTRVRIIHGKWLISGSDDYSIKFWHLNTGTCL